MCWVTVNPGILRVIPRVATIVLMLVLSALAQRDRHPWDPPFIRIVESNVELMPNGTSSNDCLLVGVDGRFHLERRIQQLPSRNASLSVFEDSLPASYIQELRAIMDTETLRKLPEFKRPELPVIAKKLRWFTADISRSTGVQHVGYFYSEPKLTTDQKVQESQSSESALRPLLQWFHSIKGLYSASSRHDVSLCIDDPFSP